MKIFSPAERRRFGAEKKNPALVQDGVIGFAVAFAHFSSVRATTYVAEVQ